MRRFRVLNLPDLKLGLDDLLSKRRGALVQSNVGNSYEAMLAHKRDAIDALPAALSGGKPLADALFAADTDHDSYGGAIYFITEAYLRLPAPHPDIIDAIRRVRAALIPELEQLRDSYADEAEAAIRRKAELPQLEADLKLIPVAGGSLYDWAVAFIGAGEKLAALLSQRADIDTNGRKGAQLLRSETVGMLNRLRDAIADELGVAKLPKDLDAQIFGYLDDLETQRAAALRASKPAKPEAPIPANEA